MAPRDKGTDTSRVEACVAAGGARPAGHPQYPAGGHQELSPQDGRRAAGLAGVGGHRRVATCPCGSVLKQLGNSFVDDKRCIVAVCHCKLMDYLLTL